MQMNRHVEYLLIIKKIFPEKKEKKKNAKFKIDRSHISGSFLISMSRQNQEFCLYVGMFGIHFSFHIAKTQTY